MNKQMFSSGHDEWETPQSLFIKLNKEFHFTLDPCASHYNHKCDKYYTINQDGLAQDWSNEIVFCNPPYSAKKQDLWIEKSYNESKKARQQLSCSYRHGQIPKDSMNTYWEKQR